MIINVAQLIYTNVEKEQSPQGIGGYQTLFYTHDVLNEDEVELIEQHLLYYPAFDNPVKKVFFSLETGKVALAQIVALPGADSRGRKGRYLAHALVFAEDEFIRQRLNPLAIFKHFAFIRQPDMALGDFTTGNITSIKLETEPAPNTIPSQQWDKSSLEQLTLYALRAATMAEEGKALAIIGSPAEVEQVLETALFAVPSVLRSNCSFDSFFYKCNFVATYFWAVGLMENPTNRRFIQFDAVQHKFQEEVALSADTAFERWMVDRLRADKIAEMARDKEIAFSLCAWLEQKLSIQMLPESVPVETLTSVFKVNPELLKKRVYDSLTQILPAVLVDKIFYDVNPLEVSSARYAELRRGFAIKPLLDLLFQALTQPNAGQAQSPIITALGEVLPRAGHPALEMLLSGWIGKWEILQTSLSQLTEDEYRQIVTRLLRCEDLLPLSLLVPARGSVFVNCYLSLVQPPQIADLVKILLRNGEAEALTPLRSFLTALTSRELRALQKTVAAYDGVPEAFTTALDTALKQNIGGGLLAGIKSWFSR